MWYVSVQAGPVFLREPRGPEGSPTIRRGCVDLDFGGRGEGNLLSEAIEKIYSQISPGILSPFYCFPGGCCWVRLVHGGCETRHQESREAGRSMGILFLETDKWGFENYEYATLCRLNCSLFFLLSAVWASAQYNFLSCSRRGGAQSISQCDMETQPNRHGHFHK